VIVPAVALPFAMPSTVHTAAPPPGTVALNCCVRLRVSAAFCGATAMMTLDTVSVAEATELAPPGPVQIKEYDVVALTGLVGCEPLPGTVPLHPSLATHDAAFVEVQVNVEVSPGATTDGYTLKTAVGITLTVVPALELPPGPEHAREKVAVPDSGPVFWVPLAATVPLQAPDAVHDVASDELHVRTAA
jgi:hypothetical protein